MIHGLVFLATCLVATSAIAQSNWVGADLLAESAASACNGATFVGNAYAGGYYAFFSNGSSTLDLMQGSGFSFGAALGCSTSLVVGTAIGTSTNSSYHPFAWKVGTTSPIDLLPASQGYIAGEAFGVFGNYEVGLVSKIDFQTSTMPYLWIGTTEGGQLPTPSNIKSGSATAIAAQGIVGWYDPTTTNANSLTHQALLWLVPTLPPINLDPGYGNSVALAINGISKVGQAGNHPALWHGSAKSFIDLLPENFTSGACNGVLGNIQVGFVQTNFPPHAAVWSGTKASYVNLEKYLPSTLQYGSAASAITTFGTKTYIYGYAYDQSGHTHSVRWSK